jgi:hypothetical protein
MMSSLPAYHWDLSKISRSTKKQGSGIASAGGEGLSFSGVILATNIYHARLRLVNKKTGYGSSDNQIGNSLENAANFS